MMTIQHQPFVSGASGRATASAHAGVSIALRAALVALVALPCTPAFAAAQAAGAKAAAPRAAAAAPQRPGAPFTVKVTSKEGTIDLAVKAEGAPLSAIAVDLATRLRAAVRVGPSIRDELITVDIPEAPLEPALASLAPRVLVDYEIRQNAAPVPREVHLLGFADPEPPRNTDARGMSQGLLITGHTEDSTDSKALGDPLLVSGDKKQLSITSKSEPLSVVAMAIGDVLGLPVQLTYDALEPVEVDLRNGSPEDLIPRISPNVRLVVRADLNKAERTLLRLVIARPDAN